MAQTPGVVPLKPATVQAFEAYIQGAETEMSSALRGRTPFLWSDLEPERAAQIRQGKILTEFSSGQGPVQVPEGLIHDWRGASCISGTTVTATLALVQDYDNHKNIYRPEVIESRLIHRQGNNFQIYLRLLKKKIITVVLDTDHEVHYVALDATRWHCRSATTRIAEVENPGKSNEKVLPADSGYGFLWRLNSYWRFQERDEGVYVECRAISLTRDVPRGLGWIIEPMIRKLPGESLSQTLEATRRALTLDRSSGNKPKP